MSYVLFIDHIDTVESQVITAMNQLKAANNRAGVRDIVLDLRYNSGGFLSIAGVLTHTIAGLAATAGKAIEQKVFNHKNPFMLSVAQSKTPFMNVTHSFSTT